MDGLGAMLKAGRKAAGLTQREIADALGVDFTYISKIENDRERFSPSDTLLSGWAKLCDLESDDVFVAAGKCPPDLLERLRTDRDFVRRVRELPVACPRCGGMGNFTDCPFCLNTGSVLLREWAA